MSERLSADQRAFLQEVVRTYDDDPDRSPQPLRARDEAGRDLAAALLRADAQGLTDDDRDAIHELRQRATLWEKGFHTLDPGLVWELTEANMAPWREAGEPGQVWVRWDAVPPEQRETVLSVANMLRDIYRGRRRAGRTPGSRPTPVELDAVRTLGAPLADVGPMRGWRHMVKAGAWEDDGRPDSDRRAQHARAERWRRLRVRMEAESAHG